MYIILSYSYPNQSQISAVPSSFVTAGGGRGTRPCRPGKTKGSEKKEGERGKKDGEKGKKGGKGREKGGRKENKKEKEKKENGKAKERKRERKFYRSQ